MEFVDESCKIEAENYRRSGNLPPLLTGETDGGLGNQMFSYATLFAVSKQNTQHKVLLSPMMSAYMYQYFKVTTCPIMSADAFVNIPWRHIYLAGEPNTSAKSRESIEAWENIKLTGNPESWRYFDEYRPDIRKEFEFRDNIQSNAKLKLNEAIPPSNSSIALIVGVHVRRGDYIDWSKVVHINLPTIEFYEGAMRFFENKFSGSNSVVFLIVSDDIPWCKSKFSYLMNELEIKFLSGASKQDGGIDMAVLTLCDHVIFGIGTFGWWGAYLSGGEVAFCSDCVLSNTTWMKDFRDYRNFVLENWKGFNRKGVQSSELAKYKEE